MFAIWIKYKISGDKSNPLFDYIYLTNYKWGFPKSKAHFLWLFVGSTLFIITLVCLVIGLDRQKIASALRRDNTTIENPAAASFGNTETFGDNTSSTTTYKPIGYGPVLDKTKVQNWINGSAGAMGLNLPADKTAWPDGNGKPIAIPSEQFKSLYGFIPPSFSYYPKGQGTNDYNEINYKTGRENCMKACSLTNCTAVQTEIPENCAQEESPTGGNSCGSNSAFSCTLFYDTINNADDAYWSIGKFSSGNGLSNSPGCFEVTGSSCLGKKYYEDSSIPIELPNTTSKPSQNIVKFCDSTVRTTNSAGYGNKSGTTCSCTNAASCNDSNCCIMRPLLTTEYVQKQSSLLFSSNKCYKSRRS
jgi:hypothetical protein